MLKLIRKGIDILMHEVFQAFRIVLSTAQNRLILGLIMLGLGCGLVASAYIRVI